MQNFGIGQISSAMAMELDQNGGLITGGITPPFSNEFVPITNGTIMDTRIRFDVQRMGDVTYRYTGSVRRIEMTLIVQGEFQPLGCINPSSGELCQTDSNGSFTVTKQ